MDIKSDTVSFDKGADVTVPDAMDQTTTPSGKCNVERLHENQS